MTRIAHPFEYVTRAGQLEGLPASMHAQMAEERDRQLEDYLASLSSSLLTRISPVSMFGAPVSGTFWENGMQNATAHGTLAGAANRIELSPVIFPVNFTVDQINARCTTGVAATNVKLVVYASGNDGYPAGLIKETASLSTATTNTTQSEAWSYTFLAGRIYWVGIRHSGAPTMRAIPVAGTPSLGIVDATATNHYTTLRRTLTYATAATDPWSFVAGDRTANVAPTAIRFRAA